ncbi:hypothetical protein [Flavisolibacter ginsenosidimutans]|uniref:Uncharacterized protein n=1 Tax=Flavisolibacter ginsenosidimutans TaxID=661481 RepID=A0A5B8UNB6_9BACT|nr:hypothetical protein [Flavisolibacter ginsenosidimutans]QEC58161.1 hypothetical protein FSB75_20370 [Flavisolibacter ginsenosidimutans]
MTTEKDKFNLDKLIWTHADYELMGWHGCRIYGLTFLPQKELGTTHLVFDIDYIFKWVDPLKPDQPFAFWVSPCTLIFKETFALTLNIDQRGGLTDLLQIADLFLVDRTEQELNKLIFEWNIDLQEGFINFKSSGFEQFVRQKPIFTSNQILTLDERNGISFSQTPYTT